MIDYAAPGPLTRLDGIEAAALEPIADDPVGICFPVHDLVIQPGDAQRIGLPSDRFDQNQLRRAARIVQALLALGPAPLTAPREPEKRVIGTCRHFAVLSCALLRYRGIPARVRCGFATYFQSGQGLDHWIMEYWDDAGGRWVRIDSEVLGGTVLPHPEDLRPGEFLSGGEAWTAFRRGEIDASQFGVCGSENWGPAEIRGNAVKDLAALNKVEMLPWAGRVRRSHRRVNITGNHRENPEDRLLLAFLQAQREAVLAIVAGLDEEAWRRPVVPSGWTPAGLLEHLGGAEWHWFQGVVAGSRPELPPDEDLPPYDPTAAFVSDRPSAEIIADYRHQCARSDAVLAVTTLSARPRGRHGDPEMDEPPNVRWVVLHMIEETARHAGHLDIARELIDGQTGLGPR